jgi:hypothetical protein
LSIVSFPLFFFRFPQNKKGHGLCAHGLGFYYQISLSSYLPQTRTPRALCELRHHQRFTRRICKFIKLPFATFIPKPKKECKFFFDAILKRD